jgi:hypothetical protein
LYVENDENEIEDLVSEFINSSNVQQTNLQKKIGKKIELILGLGITKGCVKIIQFHYYRFIDSLVD